jgi:hypothetical protein
LPSTSAAVVVESVAAATSAAVVVESAASAAVIIASVAAAGMETVEVGATIAGGAIIEVGAAVEVGGLTAAVDAVAKSIAVAAANLFELLVAASIDVVGGGKMSVMAESFVADTKAEPTAAGNGVSELPLPDPRGSSCVREAAVLALAMFSCGLSGVECDAVVAWTLDCAEIMETVTPATMPSSASIVSAVNCLPSKTHETLLASAPMDRIRFATVPLGDTATCAVRNGATV